MRILLLATVLCFAIAALAEDDIVVQAVKPGVRIVPPKCKKKFETRFRQAAIDVLVKAQNNGWKGYDGIDFAELIKRIESKEVYVGCNPKGITTTSDNKSGAMYFRDYKTIYLNYIMQDQEMKPEQFSIMAIHEHLGALHYDDNEGEISLALMYMSETVNDGLRILQDGFLRPELLASSEGGTSTGSGGGGDPHILYIKYSYFKVYYSDISKQLIEGKITLEEARRRVRRFLEIQLEIFIAQRRFEKPQFAITDYYNIVGPRCSSYQKGRGISVGAQYLIDGGLKAYQEAYDYMSYLADDEGTTVRCKGEE